MGEIRRKKRRHPATGVLEEYGPYWIRYYRDGRRFEESTKSLKKSKAEHLLRLREGAIARGEPVTPALARVTVDDALADVILDYQINAKRSLDDVQRRITKHLRPWFLGRRLSTLTPDVVRQYIAHRQTEQAANATINRELALLKRGITLAAQAGKLIARPYVPMLEEHNARQGFFEADQLDAVCRHLSTELAAVMRFASITGWRVPSEVLPLTWGQVDLEAGTVRLHAGTTKNGEGRTFPLTDALRGLLLERKGTTEAAQKATGSIIPWVFFRVRRQGRRGPLTARPIRQFQKAWEVATTAAGCPGRIPHDLRRTAVRSFVRAGIPQAVAQALSGHKTRSVFDRYNIVSVGDLTDAAAKLNAAAGTIQGRSGPALGDQSSRPA